MKKIEKLKIWNNGEILVAEYIKLVSLYDDFSSQCTIRYDLLTEDKSNLSFGEIMLFDEDYLNWDGDNNWIYNYVANKLNIVLIPIEELEIKENN